jgi:hypothetical protein
VASTLTSEQVRSDLERARALLTKTEEDFHRGTVDYERLAAVRQELRFREGLLEAVTEREARRRQEAEAEARIEKAHKDHDVLVEFYSSGLTELAGEIAATEKQLVKLLETSKRHNTERRQVHSGVDWRALDELAPVAGVNRNQPDLDGPQTLLAMVERAAKLTGQTPPLASYELKYGRFPNPDAIERQRDAILGNKKTPKPEVVASNGSHKTKGSAA